MFYDKLEFCSLNKIFSHLRLRRWRRRCI